MLKAIWEISRADHALITILAIIASYYHLTGSLYVPWEVLLVPVLFQLSVFIANDILDYKADLANNRTDRPLVRGDISIFKAKLLAVVFFLIGMLVGIWMLPLEIFLFALGVTLASFAYNAKLKDMPFVGNLLVAFTMVAPFIYTMLYVGKVDQFLLMFSYAILFFGISREIIKSIEDMEGDKKERNSNTLPILMGIKGAKEVALVFWVFYVIMLGYLLLLSPKKLLLLILLLIGFYILKKIWELEHPFQASVIKKQMLIMMFLGVLVLFHLSPF